MLSRRKFMQLISASAFISKSIFAAKKIQYNKFIVPKLETGKRIGNNVYFDLNIKTGSSSIMRGKKTNTLGINQDFLGVTLRANKGDTVHFNVKSHINKILLYIGMV